MAFPSFTQRSLHCDGIYRGVRYRCALAPYSLNGYVQLPDDHPWRGLDDVALRHVDVHGGITFAEGGVIGFDTFHLGDLVHPDADMAHAASLFCTTGTLWTEDMVVKQCQHVIDQVLEVTA